MMLANLALKLAAQRKYPVLFLHGDLVAGAEERLQNFLKEWFVKETAFDGERLERILIVWDGNSVQNDQRRYYDLQKQLFTSNVLVVGSCYTTDNGNGVCLGPDLSSGELHRLQAVVDSLGGEFRERFQAVIRNGRKQIGKQCGQSSLLYLLQTLFRFEFDEEYRAVARMLKMQFGQERVFVENSTADRLRRYVEEYNETVAAVARRGGAASYQMKLQLYLQQNFPDAAIASTKMDSLPDKERRHIRMREAVQRLNRALALAGEFGVLLPSNLLLHLLRDQDGNSYVCYGRETAQLFDVLKNDSLIEEICVSTDRFGDERYYRFRNSLEAENYICLLDDLPMGEASPKRKEREFTILMELMEAASDEEDLLTVIELVRQFGPNGHGKLSEQSQKITTGNYTVYQDYWEPIASRLIDLFGSDPEAVLVYAHFMRESYNAKNPELQEAFDNEFGKIYGEIRVRLESAIQQLEQSGETQSPRWCRLNIERCANLQQSMRYGKFNAVSYQSIVETIHRVYDTMYRLNSSTHSQRYEFSSNYMLDILLNAFLTYAASLKGEQAPMDDQEFQAQLVARVHDIDKMLVLDDMIREHNSSNLLSKIAKVYKYLGSSETLMQRLEKSFQHKNSDAYIYMRARCMWQDLTESKTCASTPSELLKKDRYLLLCNHDLPHMELESLSNSVTDAALADAENVLTYLQSQDKQIKAARSERCVMMMIRARWLQLSRNPMLAQKQRIPFTKEQWSELIGWCRTFVSFHEMMGRETFPPAYFLLGIHEWLYGDPAKAKECFRIARSDSYGDYVTIERLVLCRWGTCQERTFKVRLKNIGNGRYTATIVQETTPDADSQDRAVGRYNVGVPKNLKEHLLEGAPPRVQEFNPKMECTIRFNLSGPQLGVPLEGGME